MAESKKEILAAARRFGYEPSDDQLYRWRKRGLLPHLIERDAYGQGYGSDTYFPDGTAQQLVDLLHLRETHHRLDEIGWILWSIGHPLTGFVRERLVKLYEQGADWAVGGLEDFRDVDKDNDNPISQAPDAALGPITKEMREAVGPGRFPTLVRVLVEVAAGEFSGDWLKEDEGDFEILETGLTAGAGDDRDPTGSEMKRNLLLQAMKKVSEDVDVEHLAERARAVSDERLLEIRDELQSGWKWFVEKIFQRPIPFSPMHYVLWFGVREGRGMLSHVADEFFSRENWREYRDALAKEFRRRQKKSSENDDSSEQE